MGLLRWILGFLIAVGIAVFAIFNRTLVTVTWSPFSSPLEMPFCVAGLCLMGIGFILGALTAFINTDPLQREKRRQRKHIKNLEKQIETLHVEAGKTVPADFFPALPFKPGRKLK